MISWSKFVPVEIWTSYLVKSLLVFKTFQQSVNVCIKCPQMCVRALFLKVPVLTSFDKSMYAE